MHTKPCLFFTQKAPMISESKDEKCEKKVPIWSHFSLSKCDKSEAIGNHCLGAYSMGSDKPKYQTTTNLKVHLRSKHTNEFLKLNRTIEESKICKLDTLFQFILSVSVSV